MSTNKIDLNKSYKIELPSPMSMLITLAIGLVIGYLGPFNTYQMPLLQRALYWVILIFSGHLIYSQIDRVIHWCFQEKKPNKVLAFIAPSLIGSAILSFVVEYVSYIFVAIHFFIIVFIVIHLHHILTLHQIIK